MALLFCFAGALVAVSLFMRAWFRSWASLAILTFSRIQICLKGSDAGSPVKLARGESLRAALSSWLLGLWIFAFYAICETQLYRSDRLHFTVLFGCAQLLLISFLGVLISRNRQDEALSENRAILAWSAWAALPLVSVPMMIAISRDRYADIDWFHYEFTDKRWLVAAFVMANCAILLIPAAISRVFSGVGARRMTYSVSKVGVAKVLTLTFAVTLVWWMLGPPWRLLDLRDPLELHELVYLGPLQAIHSGQIPYAQAQYQYGPGVQLLSYLYMKLTSFDVVHLREMFAAFNFTAALVAYFLYALLLPPAYAVLAILFSAVSASPFALYDFDPGRIFSGFFGWSNPWRFMAAVILVSVFHGAYWKIKSARARSIISFGAGISWGALAWYSQENMPSGLTALGIYAFVLAMLGPRGVREIVYQVGFTLCGFALAWATVIGCYALHGEVGDYLYNYFSISSQIAQGYTNTPFTDGYWKLSYQATPYLTWFFAVFALIDVKAKRIFSEVNEQGALVLASAAIVLGCYQNALFRSDPTHLTITLVGLPMLIFSSIGLFSSRFLGGKNRFVHGAAVIVCVALITLLYPIKFPR
jgi:hypothetical protein